MVDRAMLLAVVFVAAGGLLPIGAATQPTAEWSVAQVSANVTGLPAFIHQAINNGDLVMLPPQVAAQFSSFAMGTAVHAAFLEAINANLLAGFLRLPTVILQASYMQWLVGHYGNVAGSSSNVVYTIGPVGSAALDCVQSAIAAMYGLQVDVDNTHWRLFGGREGTTPHWDGTLVVTRLCVRLRIPDRSAAGVDTTDAGAILLQDPASGAWHSIRLNTGDGFVFDTTDPELYSLGHRIRHLAVAEPVARTRVVTMVLDLVNPDGTKALNPSVDAAQATAEALARCTEPVTAAYPNGVPVPLPDVFDFTELFTHNTSSNGNIGQSRGGKASAGDNAWTAEEEQVLREAIQQGLCLADRKKLLPGRTDKQIKDKTTEMKKLLGVSRNNTPRHAHLGGIPLTPEQQRQAHEAQLSSDSRNSGAWNLELRAKFNEDRLAANLPLIDMGEGGKRALQNAIIAYRKKLQQQAQHLQDVMEGPQPDDSCRTPPSQCRRDDDPDDMDANGDSCAWPPAAKRARVC